MRRRTLAALTSLALVGAVPAAAPASTHEPTAQAASCTYGTIGGHRKCLRRGEYCARSYQRQYRRYGFSCSKRDRRGRYHLQ